MRFVKLLLLLFFFQFPSMAFSLKQDELMELARSRNLAEILSANQRAETEEILRQACRQQIDTKQWPLSCWEWLDRRSSVNKLSEKKKSQWQAYLNRYCVQLIQQAVPPPARKNSSVLWNQSRCGHLAKKFGLSFEELSL